MIIETLEDALRRLVAEALRDELGARDIGLLVADGVESFLRDDVTLADRLQKVFETEVPRAAAVVVDAITQLPPIVEDYLYSVEQVAAVLGTSRSFVYEAINAGLVPIVELGSERKPKRRVSGLDLMAFIEERRVR